MCLEMLRHLAAALGQLHIRRCVDGSAEMNIWLHRQVMVGPRARKIDVGSGGDMSEGGYEARAVPTASRRRAFDYGLAFFDSTATFWPRANVRQ